MPVSSFNLLLKPVGPSCNLDCAYCYYLGKEALFPHPNRRIDETLVRRIVKDYIQSVDTEVVCFYWHG